MTLLIAFASIRFFEPIPTRFDDQKNRVVSLPVSGSRVEGELAKSSAATEKRASNQVDFQLVASLLDALDRPLLVSDRAGLVLFTNLHAQNALKALAWNAKPDPNLFRDILNADGKNVLTQLERGKQDVMLPIESSQGKSLARVRWLPEPDWLAVYIEPSPEEAPADEAEMRQTVQELMQEREITYRNLLAAYLRLAGSEPPENGFSGVGGARIEDAAGGDEGLLRPFAFGFARQAQRAPAAKFCGNRRKAATAWCAWFRCS